jgi:hypothetical protein
MTLTILVLAAAGTLLPALLLWASERLSRGRTKS